MDQARRTAVDALASRTFVEYYNLAERPFGLVPNPRFIYQSRSYTTALTQLIQALDRREGVIVITGDVGVGKTLTCRMLLQHLPPGTAVSQILDPSLSLDDFLKHILSDFGAITAAPSGGGPPADPNHDALVSSLREFLATLVPSDRRAAIMVDEAQGLNAEVLAHIQLMMHPDAGTPKLQLILVGQPELDSLLRSQSLQRLRQAVSCRCRLQPLTPAEVGPYIERRLEVACGRNPSHAGSCPVQFTAAGVRLIGTLSRGVPRAINSLCDRSLEVGCERQEQIIGCSTIFAAVDRVPIPLPFMRPFSRMRAPRGVIARAMLSAALVTSWYPTRRFSSDTHDPSPQQRNIMSSTETDARDIGFRTRPFGFDKAEVRALLTKLLDEHEQALAQLDALRRQLSRVQSERTAEPAPQQNEAHMVERVLASAHRVADEIRREAERDAARLLSAAEDKATRVLTEVAAAAKEQSDAAADQLKKLEQKVERMRLCHREVRTALEAAVTAVGATLADISAFSTFDAADATANAADAPADATTDALSRFVQETEAKAQV